MGQEAAVVQGNSAKAAEALAAGCGGWQGEGGWRGSSQQMVFLAWGSWDPEK